MQRAGSGDGRHLESLLRGQRTGVAGRYFLQFCRQINLFHHVVIVVGARDAVGTEAHRDPQGENLSHRSDAARQLHVARRIVREAGIAALENRHIGVIQPHAMGRHRPAAEHAQGFERCRWRFAALSERIPIFRLRFGQVHHQRFLITVGECARLLENVVRHGVNRVRRHRRNHQRVVGVGFEELLGSGERGLRSLIVGSGEADHRFAQHAAHARLLGDFGNRVLEIIHVGIGGGARQRHLKQGQTRTPADEFAINVFGFGWKNVLRQPVLQVHVVGDATEKRHGRVRVGVDKAGREDGIGAVEPARRAIASVDIDLGSDVYNMIARHRDGSIFDHAALGVHGDDVAAAPDGVDWSLTAGGPCRRQ